MNFMLVQYSTLHDKIDDVVAALQEYIRAVKENEPGRLIEVYRVVYSNHFYHLASFQDEQDQKKHLETPYMRKLMESTRGLLTADIEFFDLQQIGSSR